MSDRTGLLSRIFRRSARTSGAQPVASSGEGVQIQGTRGAYTAFGYRSARIADKDGRAATGGSGAVHERLDRERLQFQSREFMRANGIYRGMIRRARDYIVGTGFKLHSACEDQQLARRIELDWAEFWKRPEVTGKLSGFRVEKMWCDELLTTGESTNVLTNLGLVQLVEPEQLKGGPSIEEGIVRDRYGRPTAYYVSPYGRGGTVQVANAQRFNAIDFIHAMEPERPSSIRGVPPSQAVFPMLHRINDVCDSEAIAWQMQARIAIMVTRQGGAPMPGAVARQDPKKSAISAEGDLAKNWLTELDYALIFHGKPGEDVKGMERTAPARNFSEALIMFFRLLGLPLGLPLEILLLDWTKSNYSQSRAVLEQAFSAFLGWQLLLEEEIYKRVFSWWMRRRMAAGIYPARDDLMAHGWIKPVFPWIDQLAEAQAYGEKVDRGFATYTQVCKSLNQDRQEVVAQLVRETIDAIEAAKQVEQKTGVKVPWEFFAGKKPAAPKPMTGEQPQGGPGQPADKKNDQSDQDKKPQDEQKPEPARRAA